MGYLFWMTLGPGAGMTIGAALRLWLMPDAVYTSEGMTGCSKPVCSGLWDRSALAGWPDLLS
jgi:hypothetical protein